MSVQLWSTKAIVVAGCVLLLGAPLSGCVTKPAEEPAKVMVWPAPPEPARFFYEQSIASSVDVVGESSADRLRQLATGTANTGERMAKPWGVAASGSRIYVGDSVAGKIHVFDVKANKYMVFGNSGEAGLRQPLDLATDDAGNLYAVDGAGKRVVAFDPEGKVKATYGDPDTLSRPSSVAVSLDGSRVYVLDTGGVTSANHRIVVFDAASAKQVSTIGTRGSKDGEFNLPLSITVSPKNGHIYVLDSGNFRVQVFDPDGKFVRSFGAPGRYPGQFARPKAISADAEGNIYVTDAWFGNFQIFSPEGDVLLAVGGGGGDEPGSFKLAAGVDVDVSDGRVYVVDQWSRTVEVFRPASQPERKAKTKN